MVRFDEFLWGGYKKLLWSYFLCPSLFSLEESVKADKVFDNFDKK